MMHDDDYLDFGGDRGIRFRRRLYVTLYLNRTCTVHDGRKFCRYRVKMSLFGTLTRH
jgi:hypothetical protein